MWAVLTPDGTLTIHKNKPTYEVMKAALNDGWLEAVFVQNPAMTMYIDEEGKLKGLIPNEPATRLVRLLPGDYIAGTAVLVGPPDRDGNDTELSTYALSMLKVVADIITEVD